MAVVTPDKPGRVVDDDIVHAVLQGDAACSEQGPSSRPGALIGPGLGFLWGIL